MNIMMINDEYLPLKWEIPEIRITFILQINYTLKLKYFFIEDMLALVTPHSTESTSTLK